MKIKIGDFFQGPASAFDIVRVTQLSEYQIEFENSSAELKSLPISIFLVHYKRLY